MTASIADRALSRNDITLHVGGIEVFNSALYQNGIQPIRKIQIANHTHDTLEGLSLVILPETEILADYRVPLPPIKPGKPLKIDDPKLRVNGEKLAALTESVTANVRIGVAQDDQIITCVDCELRILTYTQWMGDFYSDYLPAFVMPNHPVVIGLMHDAAVFLRKWEKEPALDGYQSGKPSRVLELAAAAYAAIQQKNIVYAEPPKGIFNEGQRIRTPEVIMTDRLGTCTGKPCFMPLVTGFCSASFQNSCFCTRRKAGLQKSGHQKP